MIPLYSPEEFENAKSRDTLPLKCECCEKTFYRLKKNILKFLKTLKNGNYYNYCSKQCAPKICNDKSIVKCLQCGSNFLKTNSQILLSPNHFCSHSCSAKHNNSLREIKKGKTKTSFCKKCNKQVKASIRCGDEKIMCDDCLKISRLETVEKYKNSKNLKNASKPKNINRKENTVKIKKKYKSSKRRFNPKKICRVCGNHHQLTEKSKYCNKFGLTKNLAKYFGFDLSKLKSTDAIKEFERIEKILHDDYHVNKMSTIEMANKYNHKNTGNFGKILTAMGIVRRKIQPKKFKDKRKYNTRCNCDYHLTWNGKIYIYRSSYELDFAKELDERKVDYIMQYKKIPYFNSSLNKMSFAYPDFYIFDYNLIVEIKSTYYYYNNKEYPHREQDMADKVKEYKKLGYDFMLILEHEDRTELVNVD